MVKVFFSLLLSTATLVGCGTGDAERIGDKGASHSIRPPASTEPTGDTSRVDLPDNADADDISRFLPAGAKVVDVVRGDLTGHGTRDALVVFEPTLDADAPSGAGSPRTVAILERDSAGKLQMTAENTRLVPCARCGGLAGDPYGYARIEDAAFIVAVSGGSRERWFADYHFRRSDRGTGWRLARVDRGVIDTHTDSQEQDALTHATFGDIAFADVDPASLPEPPSID